MMLVHPNLAWPGERKRGEIVLELRQGDGGMWAPVLPVQW